MRIPFILACTLVLADTALAQTNVAAFVQGPQDRNAAGVANDFEISNGAPAKPLAMDFVRVVPGTFQMGCSAGDNGCSPDEQPAHAVRITKAFEIGKSEVTQAQWKSLMDTNPSESKGDDRPVENVSWNQAQEFLNRLNARKDGYHYRLPTEAEWEYAARAGSVGPWAGSVDAVAWYIKNSGRAPLDQASLNGLTLAAWQRIIADNGNQTHPVGQKQPNAWGLFDMAGNVLEWVQDWYGLDYYRTSPAIDPPGPSTGEYRVLRGGAWSLPADNARVSKRYTVPPSMGGTHLGFRAVRERLP
jgi:formylglycine-generating enzyme required for sulfatase activity